MTIHTAPEAHLSKPVDPPQLLTPVSSAIAAHDLKLALRQLASGVSLITTGLAPYRTGFTATSVTPLSVEPPRVLVCVNKNASAFPVIKETGIFAINLLRPNHQPLADVFAGRGGVKGEARFTNAEWRTLKSGASVLTDALAALDCTVEEMIERHSHAIVIGRVEAVQHAGNEGHVSSANPQDALLYWQGQYEILAKSAAAKSPKTLA